MGLSPTPHYYKVEGRAAEIAKAMGSPAVGAEHLFLGMLRDGGWPISALSGVVDLGSAEAAVLRIVNGSGYSPPLPPRFPAGDSAADLWGWNVAAEMGDSYVGLEHAFLAMIRVRDTVPARALAGLADLDALEAAVLAAKDAAVGRAPADAVFLPAGQVMDGALIGAVVAALPAGTTFGFNHDADGSTWLRVIGPGDASALTRQVLSTALASLDRPALDDE
jgi:Clp amino terminal domain, pathogenicity island component